MSCPFKAFFGDSYAHSPHAKTVLEVKLSNSTVHKHEENDAIEVARSNENSSKDSPQVAGCPYSSIASSTDLCKGLSKSKGAASSGPSSIDCNTEQQPCDQLPATIPTNDAGSCPLGYGKVAMGQAQSKCPLGFTSGVMEGSPLNCRRCKALFHKCVVLKCGDRFCRACAASMQDCILCGADVEDPSPDPQVDGLVEKYIGLRAGPEAMSHQKALERLRQDAEQEAGSEVPAQATLPADEGCDTAGAKAPTTEAAKQSREGPLSSTPHMNRRTSGGRGADCVGSDTEGHVVAERGSGGALDAAAEAGEGCSCDGHDHAKPCVSDAAEGPEPIDVRAYPFKREISIGNVEKAAAASEGAGSGLSQSRGSCGDEEGSGAQYSTSAKAYPAAWCEERAAGGANAAAFLLEAGVQSMMGGNAEMGLACFARCEQLLLEQVAEAVAPKDASAASLLSQLGTVCGLQGDCCRQQGQLEAAEDHYERAIRHMEACPQDQDEVLLALAVTLNKMGDTRYIRQDLRTARQCYERALGVRRSGCPPAGEASPELLASRTLDLVTSLCKVADITKAMGEAKAAESLLDEGRQLVSSLSMASVPAASPLHHKLESICTFLKE